MILCLISDSGLYTDSEPRAGQLYCLNSDPLHVDLLSQKLSNAGDHQSDSPNSSRHFKEFIPLFFSM